MRGKNKVDKKGVYYVLLIVLVTLVITAILLYTFQEKNKELEVHKKVLIGRLAETIKEYKTIKTENDSLQQIILLGESRMVGMMDSLASSSNTSYEKLISYERKFYAMESELKGLQKVVDSLMVINDSLSVENKQLVGQTTALKDTKEKLEKKIESNSGLRISSFRIDGINKKPGGKEEVTSGNFWVDYLRVCFNVEPNEFSNKGERNVYVRVINPDNTIMKNPGENPVIILSEGNDIFYTEKVLVNYQGEAIKRCVEVNRDKFVEGRYDVELYIDGTKVAATEFVLD